MPTLVIQKGHCYRKSGSTGTAGEQNFVTLAADAVLALLNGRSGWSVRVILADDPINSYKGDAFVALHCDGSTNSTARGCSTGYQDAAGGPGHGLAQAFKQGYAARGWPGFRVDNYTDALHWYYGVSNARAVGNYRAIIVECGFLTNPEDKALLTAPDGPDRVALAIGDALGITTEDTMTCNFGATQDTRLTQILGAVDTIVHKEDQILAKLDTLAADVADLAAKVDELAARPASESLPQPFEVRVVEQP